MTTPLSDWFYPERQRCLECRKYLGFIVIKRLYCSYECAGMPTPSTDPCERPRECRTVAGEAKRAFRHPGEVSETPMCDNAYRLHVYACACCGMYHIGHGTGETDPRQMTGNGR